MTNAYNILIGKPEGQKPLWRHRHRWKDIRIDLRVIRWDSVDWMHWHRIGTSCGLLLTWKWTFEFDKMWESLAKCLLASQEGLCYMRLV